MENAIDIHHVFPRHWCASNNIESWVADCIVNKTALDAHTNRRIGSNAPSVYLSRIESGDGIEPHVLDGFLRSHDIDPGRYGGTTFRGSSTSDSRACFATPDTLWASR